MSIFYTNKTALEQTEKNRYTIKKNYFIQVKDAMLAKLDSLSLAQVNGAINTLTNWTPNTAVTIAKVDSLFAAVALLYVVVFYLAVNNKIE